MLEDTQRILFELSNRCNYSGEHKRCPTHLSRNKPVQILSLAVIRNVIEDLRFLGWHNGNRIISFHIYNEPTIDPRLFYIVQYIKSRMPDVKLYLMSNGWYMTKELAEEFYEVGIDYMTFSVYSKEEKHRLVAIAKELPGTKIHIGFLKDSLLNPRSGPGGYRRCFAPLIELSVRASGNIGLCCIDYDETVVFGNLYKDSLINILKREHGNMLGIQRELMKRKRRFPVCVTCHRRRLGTNPKELEEWDKRNAERVEKKCI